MLSNETIAQIEQIVNIVGSAAFIIFIGAIVFGFKRVGKLRVKVGDKEAEYDPSEEKNADGGGGRPSLIHHRLFHVLRNAMSPGFVMNAPPEECTAKWAINSTFIKDCKVKVFYDGLFEYFTDLEKHDGSGLSRLPDKISNLIDEYENEARRVPIELPGGRIIVGVPSCYMKKFNVWHTPHVKLCLSGITDALDSRFYPDWWTRATVCLEYIAMAFDLTFEDAEKTLCQLNGDLEREIAEMMTRTGASVDPLEVSR
jgi:hypothetical protein